MKRFLLFVFAIVAFAACEQAPVEEQSAIRQDAPETLIVGFEGDDTRIQLNEAQKTVWNNGDEVSVFYRTNGNQKWQYTGEDGVREANLSCVQDATGDTAITKTIVVYPYNETYWLNTDSYCIEATTPATQHYAVDSYGVGDNLMVSQGEFTQISLKNVYGWLKLQITGDGETIKSIKFRGNDGEQVAGLIYVDTATAEATLAAEMGDADDNNAGSNLVLEDTILTEVTLDCGEGVALGKEATAFYIALPPQTFDDGFTVEVACVDGSKMVKSSNKALSIERNHIQPMAEFSYTANISPSNQIWYTSSNGKVVTPYYTNVFGANIISNTYTDDKGVITFDGDVTTIGNDAFRECTNLTSVNIPDSVTTIGEDAFYDCRSLTSVNIPDNLTTIGGFAFESCTSLTSVTFPDSVTTIGERAFAGCKSLKEFKGKFATEDGRSLIRGNRIVAYANASGNTYTIPDSVTSIGAGAFFWCTSLTSVTIPDSVTTIGDWAFYNCDSLTSVNIPDSVTEIGNSAFYECSSLQKVYCYATIPASLGGNAFYDNYFGQRIYVYEECVKLYKSAWISYKDRIYTNGQNCPETTTIQYTTNDGNIVTTKNMPVVSNIYDNGVGTMVVAGEITKIPNDAFRDRDSLTSVNIPDSVMTIGNYAFYDCDSLTTVNIPDSVMTIGNYAFYSCDSLTTVNIPDSVTTIGDWAFFNCDSLTSVNIPDSVTTIGDYAFRYCDSLTSVAIPDSVTTIGNYAFASCSSLTSVTIGDSVTTIGEYAFYDCDSLTSVNIPDSVTTIGYYAFSDCDSLTSFNIPDSVTTIGSYAFSDCDSLTSITIPDSVTTIGNYAFNGCKSLTSVNIGDSVTEIGSSAFYDCDSLTSVNIPDSVTTIGDSAFYSCGSLTSVYCKATTPPALGGTYVFDSNGSGRKIYVPAGSVNAYKSAYGWSEYASAIVGYNF